jgi:subtilisin family serine protease
MIKLTIGFLTVSFLFLGTATAKELRYHPNHLFIKMKQGESLVKSSLIKKSKKLFGNLYLIKTDSADQLANKLKTNEAVDYVQRDYFSGKQQLPKHEVLENSSEVILNKFRSLNSINPFNDPEVGRLWALNSKNGMDVNQAYDVLPQYAPKDIIVAVVDTGVDHNHEDLKDVMWRNEKEIPDNRIDDDNNGYVDDIHGINTLVRDSHGQATMNTMASHWHGTHVAGTIAASQNNGLGIAGVANNVKIMAIRTVPDNSDELDSDIVEAFLYAAQMGAKVINCSFGKTVNEGGMVVRDTMNQISKKGVLVVVSAGNDSMGPFNWHNNDMSPKYPASFDSQNMIVIASTTSTGSLSGFSNIGPTTVDVASPGSSIYSTLNGNKYGMASGTSMAAPNATGVIAMVMGYFPNLKNTTVKKIIMDSTKVDDNYLGKIVSGGRVNLKSALSLAADRFKNSK